ncbi:MAG: potassium channel family protein [Micropruina sp.]|nr:MAG: potassium channel family protein [Micropruina sp.]
MSTSVPDPSGRSAILARWERHAELPLTGAALVFLAAFALPIVLYGELDPVIGATCEVLVWVTWGCFVVDYAVRLMLAPRRLAYAWRNWFDLLVIALPILRPLRLIRLVTVLRVLNRKATASLRGQIATYTVVGAALLTFVGALAVLDVERTEPQANITSFGDALWWAATTMTTVGYGDRFPITGVGRAVAVGLMVGGIGILGTVTAMLASWLVDQVAAEAETVETRLADEVASLRAEVAQLSARLRSSDATEPPS